MRGDVRCNRIIHFRHTGPEPKTHPVIAGYMNINATSGNAKWKGLSPMKLGPFDLQEKRVPTAWAPDGIHPGFQALSDSEQVLRVTNLENIWQGSKVYNIDVDAHGSIQNSFFLRRAKMARDPAPHRRALPKKAGYAVTSYWNGELHAYLQSRVIYCTLYVKLVQHTPEYRELEALVASGKNIQIIGYDGQDIAITAESMRAAYANPNLPFGHELVLCCMLTGLAPWLN